MTTKKPFSFEEAYDALKRQGHSAAKAAEIVLDAKRGDWYSIAWIELALQGMRMP